MRRRPAACIALVPAVAAVSAATAGPDWVEDVVGDAGSLPGAAAQTPRGVGAIERISGELVGGGDFEDLYLVEIVDPSLFTATTDPAFDGDAAFDSQLYLFAAECTPATGIGQVANDDSPFGGTAGAYITDQADDGSGFVVEAPGLYYIAISNADNNPVSAGGAIFDQASPTEISGPDGAGGAQPISAWADVGETGTYVIALTGVTFAFDGCPGDADFDGDVDVDDIVEVILSFSTNGTLGGPGDTNFDCQVDIDDVVRVVLNFGASCP